MKMPALLTSVSMCPNKRDSLRGHVLHDPRIGDAARNDQVRIVRFLDLSRRGDDAIVPIAMALDERRAHTLRSTRNDHYFLLSTRSMSR